MVNEFLQMLQDILSNPNVAYGLLILGLWAGMVAWAMPGTGFPEAAAIICLVLAAFGMAQLPVNMIGLAMVMVSVVLFLVDLKVQSMGLTLGASTAMALGSLFLFRPGEQVVVSRWLIALTTLGSLALFSLVLSAAVRAQLLPVKTDVRSVVGMKGVVTSALNPVGTVQVASELWTAVADTTVPVGTTVRVLSVSGVRLRVEPLIEKGERA